MTEKKKTPIQWTKYLPFLFLFFSCLFFLTSLVASFFFHLPLTFIFFFFSSCFFFLLSELSCFSSFLFSFSGWGAAFFSSCFRCWPFFLFLFFLGALCFLSLSFHRLNKTFEIDAMLSAVSLIVSLIHVEPSHNHTMNDMSSFWHQKKNQCTIARYGYAKRT